jgi:hypothetical protein
MIIETMGCDESITQYYILLLLKYNDFIILYKNNDCILRKSLQVKYN